jgi:hypothetical protein
LGTDVDTTLSADEKIRGQSRKSIPLNSGRVAAPKCKQSRRI